KGAGGEGGPRAGHRGDPGRAPPPGAGRRPRPPPLGAPPAPRPATPSEREAPATSVLATTEKRSRERPRNITLVARQPRSDRRRRGIHQRGDQRIGGLEPPAPQLRGKHGFDRF